MDTVLTPEDIQMFMDMGVSQDKIAALQKQMDTAQAVRGQAGPEGRAYGGVYTAANPLEHIGDFMQKYQANKQMKGYENDLQHLQMQNQVNRANILNSMSGGGVPGMGGDPRAAALRDPRMQQLDDLAMGRMGRGA